MKARTILTVFVVSLSACTSTRMGSLTLATTKNIGYTYSSLQQHVIGEDCAENILGIPLGSMNPNVQEAIDKAVSQVPSGDMMTNVTVHDDLFFALLYNQVCVRVDGDVVRSTNSFASAVPNASATRQSVPVSSSAGGNTHSNPAPQVRSPNVHLELDRNM